MGQFRKRDIPPVEDPVVVNLVFQSTLPLLASFWALLFSLTMAVLIGIKRVYNCWMFLGIYFGQSHILRKGKWSTVP